jgi:hypothetical protein
MVDKVIFCRSGVAKVVHLGHLIWNFSIKFPYKGEPIFNFTPDAHYTGGNILISPRVPDILTTPLFWHDVIYKRIPKNVCDTININSSMYFKYPTISSFLNK